MRLLQNSYAKYFNTKHERSGVLFQGAFRAVHVETDEQLLHVSRYIHLNPVSANLIHKSQLASQIQNSFKNYINKDASPDFIETNLIMNFFNNNKQDYSDFVLNYADTQKQLQQIKHLFLE